ncbi:MAG TPA: ribulokinase [Bryobacteraceae bacterium]|jgi:L-ribulokinase|nr:ribulokinase [Bryobacteraceae bacterium]
MTIVAGVDFGTLSVRVSLFDSERGRLGGGVAEYPLHRTKEDPDHATQSHADHMTALAAAVRAALHDAGVEGLSVDAIALDTTGSSVIPVDAQLQPLDDYYLWCDHRAWKEAAEITAAAHERGLGVIEWYGGSYSSEWGFAKLLHWLRHNPEKRERFATAFEHCDMVAAVLCGIQDPLAAPRSICAMGHKWLWNPWLGGFPSDEFLTSVDPLLEGVRDKLEGRYETSDKIAGHLTQEWAGKLGLRAGIPIPVGAFDAHWDAIGAGVKVGDLVNVVGTSTCIMAISDETVLVPGVCGVVPGSIDPNRTGIEAGLSATGDIFDAIARRAGTSVAELSQGLDRYRAGETGLLRLTWDNGDRTVLVNPELSGITLGWRLTHTAQDELFAAIEGTAFHTRVILDRMQENGVPIHRVINGGGIPRKNPVLNQVYANVLGKPILVPKGDVTSLGSAIFAFLAAGTFRTVEEAQAALCPGHSIVEPQADPTAVYQELYALYRKLYFSFGQRQSAPAAMGEVLPELRRIAAQARGGSHAGQVAS